VPRPVGRFYRRIISTGRTTTPIPNGGAKATITVGAASMCTGYTGANHVSAWAMIADPNPKYDYYVQAGYIKTELHPSAWRTFVESNGPNLGRQYKEFDTVDINTSHTFTVYYFDAAHDELVDIDGAHTWPSGEDPASWSALAGDWFGEVFYQEDEMPGTLMQPATFDPISIQPSEGSQTFSAPTTSYVSQDTTQGCFNWDTKPEFQIHHNTSCP
jgi:hypothetical protein